TAAEAFNEEPSAEAYEYFNAAYNAVLTNTPLDASISETVAPLSGQARFVDLLGRPVAEPRTGSLLIDTTARRATVIR
ncbi:MAG: hypothetical protein K2N10_07295, partial [Muribaculaceae bacterium]|nr:hypothetical protein [Muribaculaceae bacterium]